MKTLFTRKAALIGSLAASLVAASLVVGGASARTASAPTLVVDNSFTIKTSDPGRAFDPTASMIDRALYDTLFTYKGDDLAHPIPLLVSSWKASSNAETFTFQLKHNVHFADGTPLTSADVVWSLKRLVNLKGNPAFLLAGVSVSPSGKYAVVMHSKTPDTELPVILANPSTGILNSALVTKNGGSDAANAREGRHGRELAQLERFGWCGQRSLHAQLVQHDLADLARAEHELLGLQEVALVERRRPQHDRPDPAPERRPRLARDRDRPLG